MEEQKTFNEDEKENEIRRENLNAEVFIVIDKGEKIKKESGGNQSADLEFKEDE